jgi:hypothetical protein
MEEALADKNDRSRREAELKRQFVDAERTIGWLALENDLLGKDRGGWREAPRSPRPRDSRGKKGGVIGCAVANRTNKIAYALVRDQPGALRHHGSPNDDNWFMIMITRSHPVSVGAKASRHRPHP